MTRKNFVYLSMVPLFMLAGSVALIFTAQSLDESVNKRAEILRTRTTAPFENAADQRPQDAEAIKHLREMRVLHEYNEVASDSARNKLLASLATLIGLCGGLQLFFLILVYRDIRSRTPAKIANIAP